MGTVVGTWRLKIIILLVILLPSLYYVNSFFYDAEIKEDISYDKDIESQLEYNATDDNVGQGQDFISVIFRVGDYLTFGNINNPYARFIINIFVLACWIMVGYVIYTFFKEWIPFV